MQQPVWNTSRRLRNQARNLYDRWIRQWPAMLLVSTVAVTLGLFYGAVYRPTYQSQVQVRLGEELDARMVPGQREDPGEWADLPETLANAFRARLLLDVRLRENVAALGRQPELAHLPKLQTKKGQDELVEDIRRTLLVEAVTRRLFIVTYNARDPHLSQLVLTRLIEDGIQQVIDQRLATARRVRSFLAEETERARNKLLEAETRLVKFVEKHPKLLVSMTVNERNKLGLQTADKLLVAAQDRVLGQALVEHSLSSVEVKPLLQKRAELEAQIAGLESVQKRDLAQQKQTEIERLQQQLLELKGQGYQPDYPEVQRVSTDIDRLSKELRDPRPQNPPMSEANLLLLGQTRIKLAALEQQLVLARRKLLGGDKLAPDPELLAAEATYARLVHEMESAKGAHDKLRDRELESAVNAQLIEMPGNAAARIVDPARFPLRPRGLDKALLMALLSALGVCFGVLVGFVRSLSDPRIFSAFDLSRASCLPVLAQVPLADRGQKARRRALCDEIDAESEETPKSQKRSDNEQIDDETLVPDGKLGAQSLSALGYVVHEAELKPISELPMLSSPNGEQAEQYRLMACRLRENNDPRFLLVVSSQPGEGASEAAANLALALAEGEGAQVALLDAQFLSPRLPALLLAGIELGRNDLRQAKPACWRITKALCFFPGSELGLPDSGAAVENSVEFASLLKDLGAAFDYVIVDAPPATAAADARLLARHGARALLWVRAGQTDAELLAWSVHRVGRHRFCGTALYG